MKLLKSVNTNILILIMAFFTAGCGNEVQNTAEETAAIEAPEDRQVVEVTAVGLNFEAPDTIPSGWNTFRFNNPSGMIHFAILALYPEGKGVEDHQEIVAPVFQNFMDDYNGKEPSAPEAGFELPDWFSEITFFGGPGLLSHGYTSETTVELTPGTYVMECYVKTNGVFHSYNPNPEAYGMVHEFTVTDEKSEIMPPEPTLEISISSEEGYRIEGTPTAGEHIVEVTFEDQEVYDNFVGHDVHLVKLEDTTKIETVAEWMNWTNTNGLETPAPAQFLGGASEMPQGSKAYFSVQLVPGKYAWIAEIPNPADHGMLEVFTVEDESI